MKQELLRAASVCALVIAMGGAAVAQGGGGSSSGGGSSGSGDTSGGSSPGSSGATSPSQQTAPGGTGTGEARPATRNSRGETSDKSGATERRSDKQQKNTKTQTDGTTSKSSGRSETQDGRKGKSRASEERSKDQKDRKGAASGNKKDMDQRQSQQDRRTGGGDSKEGPRTDLSEQQRTSVRERIVSKGAERDRVSSVNFELRVGASVPRDVTLHILPPDVVGIAPGYSSYRYVYVGDDIVIVNPTNYRVVTVLGNGSRTAGARRSITVAQDDRVFVREHIDRGSAIRLGIGGISVGMNVPDTVELLPLPNPVVERVPDLRDHRYFVYEDDIAIVDPGSGEVVLILSD